MQLILTALDCEARPLLDQFRLRSVQQKPFAIYRNDTLALAVSGIGRVNMAAATAYLAAIYPGLHSWLNIGIGGQRDYALGSCWLAHKISTDGQSWYPPLVITAPCPSSVVQTVDQPELTYPTTAIYDMEAAGFYPTAARFAPTELVQSLKIISDNHDHDARELRPAKISQLLADAIGTITNILQQQEQLQQILLPAEQLMTLPEVPWPISTTQQHQLRELLRRYRVRLNHTPDLSQFAHAKACLSALRQKLQQQPQLLA